MVLYSTEILGWDPFKLDIDFKAQLDIRPYSINSKYLILPVDFKSEPFDSSFDFVI